MKTVILYASKYGYTAEIVENIKAQLDGDVQAIDVSKEKVPNLEHVDGIILGSSIYVGQIHKSLKQWMEQNQSLLLSKRIAVFLCSGFASEFEKNLQANFPKLILDHALSCDYLGGRIDKSKLSFMHKQLVNMIEKTEAGKQTIHAYPEHCVDLVQRFQSR